MSSVSRNAAKALNKRKKKSRTVCITKKTKNGIEIDDDVLRRFFIRPEIGDKPIAIISIVGEMRKGKSTLMNFFVRFFQRNRATNWMDGEDELLGKDFETQGGQERCTEGILILDQVFEMPMENGEKMAVLLMDIQGLFDHETTPIVNKTLLSLSTLLSSVQIFNVQGVINTQHLDYLETCMDFAVVAAEKAGYMKLQSLVFLVRDFTGDKDGKKGFDAGETMLKKIIGSQQGSQLGITKRLKTDFTDVKCFAMVHPGRVPTCYDFDGKLRDFQKEFLDEVKVFIENIADPKYLLPKRSTSEESMTARDLLYMITSCGKIFVEDVFEASRMMEANEKAYYSVRYEKAYAKYTEDMETYLKEETYIDEKLLEEKHGEVKETTLKAYDDSLNLGDKNVKSNYRKHLVVSCNRLCKAMKDRLREQLEEKRERARHATAIACLTYENLMKIFCGRKELFEEEHNRHLRAICRAYKGRVDKETLTLQIGKIHQRLALENEKRWDEFGHKEEETRLMRFVYVDLRVQCMQEWEKLQISHEILDPAFIKGASIGIEKFAVESYWQKALTPDQLRYKKKQKKMMKKVRRSQIQQYQPVPYSLSSLLSGDEKENDEDRCNAQKLSDLVGRLVNEFTKLLKEKLSTGKRGEDLLKIATDLEKETEEKFLNECSPHLLTYHKEVFTMLNHLQKDVQKRNDELWEEKKQEIHAGFANWIFEVECELRKVMVDRHLDEAELKQFYADLKKPEAFDTFRSIREKKEVNEIMKEILPKSRTKMEIENDVNQPMRPIKDSTQLPSTEPWYRQFAKWFKGKFSPA